jgi:hypothetical protein
MVMILICSVWQIGRIPADDDTISAKSIQIR